MTYISPMWALPKDHLGGLMQQAMAWLDAHSIGWSLAVLFIGMLLISGAACLADRILWRWAHRHEIREEREMAARVERLRG